jgi:hypothetical protein
MIWQAAFLKRILDAPGIAAQVDDRVEFLRRSEGDPLPAINLFVASDDRPDHFKGAQELRRSRVQVDVMADDMLEALDLAERAIAAVRDPATVEDVIFERASIEGPETSGEQETGLYVNRARFDALVWHRSA